MTSQPIGSLYAALGLDSAQFDAGIDRSRRKLEGFGKVNIGKGLKSGLEELETGFRDTASKAGVFGAALSGMGLAGVAAAAAIVGIGAAMNQARNALAFADDIADTANKLAVSTDALQEYRFAVHQLGGDYKDADAALDGFSKKFGAAHAGLTKKAAKPFEALGLDAKAFDDTETALEAVIERISALKSTAEQAAIADKLGLSSMLPALREGSAAIEEMRLRAHDLGYVMDSELAERAGAANDKFEDLQQILDVQFKSTMVDLAPLLLTIAGGLAEAAKAANDFSSALRPIDARSTDTLKRQLTALQARSKSPLSFLYGGPGADRDRAAAVQAELARRAGEPKIAPRTGRDLIPAALGGGKDKSGRIAEASAAAVANAVREELQARMALTGDISKLARMREQEIDAQLKADNERLAADAAEGKITRAAAAKAQALNAEAAAARKTLIAREEQADIEADVLSSRREISRFYEDLDRLEASMAATAGERNEIERKSLAERQSLEADELRANLAKRRAQDEITEEYRLEALARQAEVHATERRQATREADQRIADEIAMRRAAELQLQIDLLQSQYGLADSVGERAGLDLQVLSLEQQLERIKLEEIVHSATASKAEKDIAAARLAVLGVIQKNQKAAIWRVEDAFNATADAVYDMKGAIDRHDWGGMMQSLAAAIQALKTSFGPNGTIASRMGAFAGLAGAAGNIIGGRAGGALAGAASGFMAGNMILPGVGGLIGGALGAIGSLFGSSKAKKQRKAQEAAQKAAEEAARQQEIANQRRELEIQLMEAAGDAAGALAARRKAELEAMDASNRSLQEQVWAAQDAAEIASDRRRLEIEMMEATGDAAGALAARRADELKALDVTLRGLQEAVWAAEDLAAANAAAQAKLRSGAMAEVQAAREALAKGYEREATALKSTITRFQDWATSLREFRLSLMADALEGPTSAAAAMADFDRTAKLARMGDEQAMGKLISAGEKARDASASSSKTLVDHLRTLAGIQRGIQGAEDTATRQASIAEQQLASLDAMMVPLLGIREDLRPVPLLLAGLQQAFANFTLKTGQKLGANPAANTALIEATGYTGDFGSGGWNAWILQQDEETKAKARAILMAFSQPERVGFASAGSFTVGGHGGIDKQHFGPMSLSTGEMVNITHGDTMAALRSEIRGLRADLRAANGQIATNTATATRLMRKWDRDGQPPERTAA